jgi:hypothetical protein
MPILCQFVDKKYRATAYGLMNMVGVFAGAFITDWLGKSTDAGNLGKDFAMLAAIVVVALLLQLFFLNRNTMTLLKNNLLLVMLRKLLFFLTFFITGVTLSAQKNVKSVFVSGEEGHKSYRIPAMIALPNGHLLAFAERVNHAGDFGDVNIVLKISKDKGLHGESCKLL